MSRPPFLPRVLRFLRPSPVFKPLSVDTILANQEASTIVEQFVDLYYTSGVSQDLNWRGTRVIKNPCDLWMTIELLQRLKPAAIIETGTHEGGSALLYADMSRALGLQTTVITIDPNPKWAIEPQSAGVVSIRGYSTDEETLSRVAQELSAVAGKGPIMVYLDSDHSEANVLSELQLYSKFVTLGSYLVVEDTIVNGHPSFPGHGPGPWEAVNKFLASTTEFAVDTECERFLLTFNRRGWLRRIV